MAAARQKASPAEAPKRFEAKAGTVRRIVLKTGHRPAKESTACPYEQLRCFPEGKEANLVGARSLFARRPHVPLYAALARQVLDPKRVIIKQLHNLNELQPSIGYCLAGALGDYVPAYFFVL